MIKSKIIIHNYTDCSDEDLMGYIKAVIKQGKISNHNKQYCYVTTFVDGTTVITEKQNKKETYTFKVYKKEVEEC